MTNEPQWTRRAERYTNAFEAVVLWSLYFGLALLVVVGVVRLYMLFAHNFQGAWGEVQDAMTFQEVFQRALGGFLVILLGLELMETVKIFTRDHHVKLEVVFLVAMIAVGRHIIQLDYHESTGISLLGIAAIVFALGGGYYLVRRASPAAR